MTPLEGAVVGAVASILGGLVVTIAQHFTEKRRLSSERDAHDRRERREIYLALIGTLEQIDSGTSGALATSRTYTTPVELGRELRRLVVAAELVSGSRWPRMKPYIELISARANYMTVRSSGADTALIQAKLDELDAADEEASDTLRSRLLEAIREDLGVAG